MPTAGDIIRRKAARRVSFIKTLRKSSRAV
jgi:hypothetical protein